MDEKKTPQPEQAAPETGKPLSEKRKSALLRYMAVLFCAAFILVLISLILQTHSSKAKISELNAASTSALSNAEALQNENRALQDDKIALEKENQELLARKCMSFAMECIRAHIFVAIDCGEEQMKPTKQNVKEQKVEHQEGGMMLCSQS